MSVNEKNILLQKSDGNGNSSILYPITNYENVQLGDTTLDLYMRRFNTKVRHFIMTTKGINISTYYANSDKYLMKIEYVPNNTSSGMAVFYMRVNNGACYQNIVYSNLLHNSTSELNFTSKSLNAHPNSPNVKNISIDFPNMVQYSTVVVDACPRYKIFC